VRCNNGIIDKYIGDGIMAFWGPPFTGTDDHSGPACLAALDQLAGLAGFRSELPEITGLRRGFPEVDIRIGIATGDVVVGNIGSEQTRNYTVLRAAAPAPAPMATVAGAVILGTAIVLSPALASCSASDCAYYGSPDANTRCVVISAPTTGGGQ
jgi:class 3 adenylate cyclase